jgi:hypothetical protein
MKKKSICILVCMLLIASFAITSATKIEPEKNTLNLDPWTYGTLCTSSGKSIKDSELRNMLDTFIPTTKSHSTLIVLTQCYGGDTMEALTGRPETTVLSATSPGETAQYGGYDDDSTIALKPGANRTSDDVHNAGVAGKDPTETPQKSGPTASLQPTNEDGDIKSRHVLVYAGIPWTSSSQPADNWQRDTIENNFAGEYQTTVTTVGGDGTGGWDYPGTFTGLQDAIKDIGQKMNENEQFILYVTDHGDIDAYEYLEIFLPPLYYEYWIDLPPWFIEDIIVQPEPDPCFRITTIGPVELLIDQIIINDYEYTDYDTYEIDLDLDGYIDYYEYDFGIDPYNLDEENFIQIYHAMHSGINVSLSLGSGPIAKTESEIQIDEVRGGIGITAYISNIGTTDVETPVSIVVTGGLLGMIDMSAEDLIYLPAGDQGLFSTGIFFGFGPISVEVTADSKSVSVSGMHLLIFSLL